MYTISVEDSFSSAHSLREYKGKCENLHGHNWKVKVVIKGEKLDPSGMLIDFTILRMHLKNVLEALDHKFLNDVPPFNKINPSAENISFYIYERMKKLLSKDFPHVEIDRIEIWESDTSCASYINE